jgi:hypothetical protein
LVVAFARGLIFTAARWLIIGWFVYFGLHFAERIEPPAHLYLLIFPLSVFGLWELTGLPKKLLRLDERPSPDDDA